MNNFSIISPDLKCNNKCIMCQDGFREDNMNTTTNYNEFLDNLNREINFDNTYRVAISGGEPTLYPHLFELVQYLKSKGINNITLYTNARQLKDENYLLKLIDAGINHFHVALHSHIKDIATKISGVENSYDETLIGLKNINGLKKDKKYKA